MWRQAFRPTAAVFSALLLCSAPALAGTVRFADVTTGAGPARTSGDVRLRVAAAGQDPASQQGPAASQVPGQQPAGSVPSAPGVETTAPGTGDGTLSQSGAGQVETVDLGDVTGTVCDCGVIPDTFRPSGGGFPWWPLLGGAIVPFLFRDGDNPPDTPENPEPTPPPPSIPEPATLLLFGTGLLAVGARARRRLAGKQALAQTGSAEEV